MLKCSCREQYIRLNCTLVVYSIVSYTFNIASLHLNEWTGQAFMFFFLHNDNNLFNNKPTVPEVGYKFVIVL